MFKWFSAEHAGIVRIQETFDEMVEGGRHAFDRAFASVLGEADPQDVTSDVIDTDRRVNALERNLRQRLLVHMVVNGKSEIPITLKWMSVVKDAERIGDQAKNVFDLGRVHPTPPDDEVFADIARLRVDVSQQLGKLKGLLAAHDESRAREIVEQGRRVQRHCEERVMQLVTDGTQTSRPVVAVLLYRHAKRASAHAMNIATAVLVPLDRLDQWDEDEETRVPAEP